MKRGEKLEFYMKEKGYTARSLSRESDVAYTTIRSMIENDLKNSSIDNVIKLCKALGIQVEDLLEENFNESYVAESKTDKKVITMSSTTYRYLPDVKVSAGIPSAVEGATECEMITIPDNLLGKYAGSKDIFFMRVNGESMNNVIPHDSLIAVKQATIEEIKNGDIVVFSNGYDYSVKFFYETDDKFIFKPSSTEPIFTDYILEKNSEELRLHGKVITYVVNLD